jgi:hypothetical protein
MRPASYLMLSQGILLGAHHAEIYQSNAVRHLKSEKSMQNEKIARSSLFGKSILIG